MRDGYDRNDMEFWTEGRNAPDYSVLAIVQWHWNTQREWQELSVSGEHNGSVEKVKPVSGKKIYFRATMNWNATTSISCTASTDNKNSTPAESLIR